MSNSKPEQDSSETQATEGLETLPPHTVVGEFEITGVIGEGGFGTVYLAHDHSLERQVALKEYRPAALATRTGGRTVAVRSQRHAEAFEAGLRSFINEARTLAKFDHPALVKVYRFWQENNTAYMAMPLYEGRTLKEVVKDEPQLVTEAWLKGMLAPLLDAVEALHGVQIYHRDIAPDNILILENGAPVLLDFGAARQIIADMTQALTVILKPGFAPIEQYAEDATMKQGPWTDIYALSAVLYFAITKHPPPNSVSRAMTDTKALRDIVTSDYSRKFLSAIEAGLAPRPEARPQNIAEFRKLLGVPSHVPGGSTRSPTSGLAGGATTTGLPSTGGKMVTGGPSTVSPTTGNKGKTSKTVPGRSAGTADPDATVAVLRKSKAPASQAPQPAAAVAAPPIQPQIKPQQSSNKMIIGAAAVAVVVALVGGAAWFKLRQPAAVPTEAASASASAPAPASEPVAVVEATPSKQDSKPAAETAVAVVGSVRFAVKPWGVVSVDGVSKGASPPLKQLQLPEGKHKIEISHTGFTAYSTEIQVQKDRPATVSYQFK